jgi:LPXTG-site transpeptidase (sortase) family protein
MRKQEARPLTVSPCRDILGHWPYRGFVGNPASWRPLPGSGRTWVRELGLALVTLGFVVLLFAAYELVGTNLSEEHSQAQLAREFNATVAHVPRATAVVNKFTGAAPAGTKRAPGTTAVGATSTDVGTAGATSRSAPADSQQGQQGQQQGRQAQNTSAAQETLVDSSPTPPPGGALDHLVIPAIGLSRYVVQGVTETDLQMGPGHYPGTPLPGQAGNVGIAGHRTTFGAPFFRLNEISRGDRILLTDTSGTTWVYSVVKQWVVPPSDTGVLARSHVATLTLTTCNPRFEATSRLVVRAALLERIPRGSKVASQSATLASGRWRANGVSTASGAGAQLGPTTATAPPVSQNSTNPFPVSTNGGKSGEGSPTVGSASSPVADSQSQRGNGWAWLATIGFGLLALFGWVGTRIFAAHMRRYATVIVMVAGALVCLVPLWFAFENLVDLLPANI